MTNEQEKAKELVKLLNAFADRKQLQHRDNNDCWKDWIINITIHEIYSNVNRIRIKPETKRTSLTQQDLIDRELSGKTMMIRIIGGSIYQQIIAFGKEYLTVNGGTLYYGTLIDNYEFLDGTPCCKEVEGE